MMAKKVPRGGRGLPPLLLAALPLCISANSLLCPHLTATLTLDWTGMVDSGKKDMLGRPVRDYTGG